MLKINRVARGLLSFFDGKTAQQPPQTVEDMIRCTVDMGLLMMWGAAENISGPTTGITSTEGFYPTANNAGDVPQDETWILLRCSIVSQAILTGTDVIAGAIGFRTLGSGVLVQDHILNVNQSFGVNNLPAFYMAAPPPIILHPGDRLGFLSLQSTIAAAAPTLDLNARVFKLKL